MKKTFTRILLLAAAFVLALGLTAHAEEAPAAEAWLLYFASNHVTDQADFPWWPQHQRIDQPASETGVEYTNAIVTGPGYYTTSLKFNWNKAEGAIQFNLIIKDAETLFPGYYCEIMDIRVNGQSIDVKDNLYGTYHDDPASGMVSIYNTYWDEAWGGAGGPNGHRAWDNAESAHWLIINPDDIVAGDTIEVDFMFAEAAGVRPEGAAALRVLAEGPTIHGETVKLTDLSVTPDNATTARLCYIAGGWWPTASGQGAAPEVTIKGEGEYTASAYFVDQGGWTPSGNGAEKLILVVADGKNGEGTVMDGMYLGVSDVRVNGNSIALGDAAFGPTGYADGTVGFDENDGYSILYDSWMAANQPGLPWGHQTWSGAAGTTSAINPGDLANVSKVEVDFFVTSTLGEMPKPPVLSYDYKWYPNNTMGVAGYSLRDLGITDKWYNVVPVNLTVDGIYKIPMVASNMFVIGNAIVTVEGGSVTVEYETQWASPGNMTISSECVKWFDEIADVTADFCANPQSDLAFGEAYSAAELGNVGYLFICNRVTYCQPITDNGIYLPSYSHAGNVWADYRAGLDAMVAEAEAAD